MSVVITVDARLGCSMNPEIEVYRGFGAAGPSAVSAPPADRLPVLAYPERRLSG